MKEEIKAAKIIMALLVTVFMVTAFICGIGGAI